MTLPTEATLVGLQAGAAAFGRLDVAARAELARRTALSIAEVADAWVDAAVGIKSAGGIRRSEVRAEETATGPLASLRLLLITARCLGEVAVRGVPRPARPPHLSALGGSDRELVGVEIVPEPWIADRAMFAGHRVTVRCAVPGGLGTFQRVWREEWHERSRQGTVALILGAGNVTGLAVADAVSQIFEHGRAVLLKLHPLHEPLVPVFRAALAPLAEAGLLVVVSGNADVAAMAIASPRIGHVHLTGGRATFDAIVWGPGCPADRSSVALAKPITCELGGVTPWIVVPGRYTAAQLRYQADLVAVSIVNNTSFNCIATKCVVTCRGWEQRSAFLELVSRRLASLPRRPAWYPGAATAWEQATQTRAPDDGTLPWVFHAGLDPAGEPRWLEREWFAPVAVEVPLDAADIEAFCARAASLARSLPGNLACSVTVPESLATADGRRVELLADHLEYGVVAINTWSALGYALASVPWGGFPGGTLLDPGSGIGFVHDPYCLPLVHNSILRGPLVAPPPPWLSWHPHGESLARGVVEIYASLARGGSGLWPLLKMLPRVLGGGRSAVGG